jgi:hypothetical protein
LSLIQTNFSSNANWTCMQLRHNVRPGIPGRTIPSVANTSFLVLTTAVSAPIIDLQADECCR